jgi:hypothetical protein
LLRMSFLANLRFTENRTEVNFNMKKSIALVALFVFALTLSGSLLLAAEGSWTGEVIDVACYASHQAKGAGHMECGSKCVKAGLPVGLLVGETTYVLVGSDHKTLNDKLAEHVGHTVTVTGEKFESNGANVITVKDFKMAAATK